MTRHYAPAELIAALALACVIFGLSGRGEKVEAIWSEKRFEILLILVIPLLYRLALADRQREFADALQHAQILILITVALRVLHALLRGRPKGPVS